jgi:hypothetical protein
VLGGDSRSGDEAVSRKKIDHEKIKAEVAKYTEGGRVWKVMAFILVVSVA